MNQQDRRAPSTVQVIEGNPPNRPGVLVTVSLFTSIPDLEKEKLFLGKRGICKGYVHTIGSTRVISYFEEDKVKA